MISPWRSIIISIGVPHAGIPSKINIPMTKTISRIKVSKKGFAYLFGEVFFLLYYVPFGGATEFLFISLLLAFFEVVA